MDGIEHLYKNTFDNDFKVFFLIIPILVFVLVAALLLSQTPKNEAISSIATPNVLGESAP